MFRSWSGSSPIRGRARTPGRLSNDTGTRSSGRWRIFWTTPTKTRRSGEQAASLLAGIADSGTAAVAARGARARRAGGSREKCSSTPWTASDRRMPEIDFNDETVRARFAAEIERSVGPLKDPVRSASLVQAARADLRSRGHLPGLSESAQGDQGLDRLRRSSFSTIRVSHEIKDAAVPAPGSPRRSEAGRSGMNEGRIYRLLRRSVDVRTRRDQGRAAVGPCIFS